jgi:hypothetical protein
MRKSEMRAILDEMDADKAVHKVIKGMQSVLADAMEVIPREAVSDEHRYQMIHLAQTIDNILEVMEDQVTMKFDDLPPEVLDLLTRKAKEAAQELGLSQEPGDENAREGEDESDTK